MAEPRLLTIPAGEPFVDLLAEGLLRRGRERCAATCVLLPSRRAALSLRDAFLRVSGGAPLLLPRMLPVGDLDEDEIALDGGLALDLPPAIAPLRRQLLLTRLVQARGEMPLEQAVRLAAELAAFLDEMGTEEVPMERLPTLVGLDLAEHWARTLKFLHLLEKAWPAVLDDEGALDQAVRRNRLLDAAAARWTRRPPRHDIVAAGVVGTVPAVARLLGVVARLPTGCVVLPGLDTAMADADWQAIEPAHPQYGFKRLLEAMDAERLAVRRWPDGEPCAAPSPRARLLADVLRPAATTEAWQGMARPDPAALAGLTVVRADDQAAEALQIALRLREVVETPGRTGMLVTSDRNLARRVAAELRRWDIEIDDSAGVPLDQTPPGGFLLLTAHAFVDGVAPVPLLAALKHPLARGGMAGGEFRRHVRALERACLRGPRTAGGLDGLVARIRDADDERWPAPVPRADLLAWLEALRERAAPLLRLAAEPTAPLTDFLDAHLALAEHLAADEAGNPAELWATATGEAAQRFVAELRIAAADLPPLPASAYPAVLAVLMGGQSVRPRRPRHPRLAILGQLESRLTQADLVILGGLVEGVWPRIPDTGPWLNRRMRAELGLPPLDLRIGIAAHDFYAAASAPEVVLTRALKDEAGAPTKPSRWLARLDAVLRSLDLAGAVAPPPYWARWTRELDDPGKPPAPVDRPLPRPPLAARPRRLSISEIEQLMRDPYAVYARRILDLSPLDALDEDPGAAERGTVIHKAIEDFVRAWPEELPADPVAELLRIGRQHFALRAHLPQVWALWWPRFVGIAHWFVERERERRGGIARVLAEVRGQLVVEAPGGPVQIRARADRVEVGHDGGLAIVDYKTGQIPSAEDVRRGLRPQLALEAAIAIAGGFAGIASRELAALALWRLSGGDEGGVERDPTQHRNQTVITPAELAAEACEGVARLLAHFDDPATAYIPVPRPEIAPTFADYDHLSRLAEWRGGDPLP
ncbi:MAG: double-strand break repair protein AddB [Geminicoccaceae bacterium]